MKQPDNMEKGNRIDLIRHRFSRAKEDLDTACLLLDASQYRGQITEPTIQFIIRLMPSFPWKVWQ